MRLILIYGLQFCIPGANALRREPATLRAGTGGPVYLIQQALTFTLYDQSTFSLHGSHAASPFFHRGTCDRAGPGEGRFLMMATTRASSARRLPAGMAVALRVLGAIAGGYAFTAALVALLAAALPLLGLARSEAVVSAAMLGFVIYLLVLLWAFSVRSLARLWAVLAGGTGLAFGLFQLVR